MRTFHILYGWSEGPWHGRQLASALLKRGLVEEEDVHRADIIIAHSGGCYLIPVDNRAEIILLIGLPFWPGKSLLRSMKEKIGQDYKEHHSLHMLSWWLHKTTMNTYYMFTQPLKNHDMLRHYSQSYMPVPHSKQQILLVRNAQDSFCHPKIEHICQAAQAYQIVRLAGGHDNCWLDPKAYVDLLKPLT